MIKAIVSVAYLFFSLTVFSSEMDSPAWFKQDIARKAKWLPSAIKNNGLETAYKQRLSILPYEVANSLQQLNIPAWMIALIPSTPSMQYEIHKQLLGITLLRGPSPKSKLARRAEELLIFGAAAQLPTPGDKTSGASLGPEGCTAAMSKYILSQLKLEFPERLAKLPNSLATTQSSVEMKALFIQLARSGEKWFEIKTYPFDQLQASHIRPGSIMIAQKPGGTHVLAWTRVLDFWNWSESAKIAIANTGLPKFGSRLILAQEYISDDPELHNEHGPINSNFVIRDRSGRPVLSDPRTNVYATRGANFVMINFTY